MREAAESGEIAGLMPTEWPKRDRLVRIKICIKRLQHTKKVVGNKDCALERDLNTIRRDGQQDADGTSQYFACHTGF